MRFPAGVFPIQGGAPRVKGAGRLDKWIWLAWDNLYSAHKPRRSSLRAKTLAQSFSLALCFGLIATLVQINARETDRKLASGARGETEVEPSKPD